MQTNLDEADKPVKGQLRRAEVTRTLPLTTGDDYTPFSANMQPF